MLSCFLESIFSVSFKTLSYESLTVGYGKGRRITVGMVFGEMLDLFKKMILQFLYHQPHENDALSIIAVWWKGIVHKARFCRELSCRKAGHAMSSQSMKGKATSCRCWRWHQAGSLSHLPVHFPTYFGAWLYRRKFSLQPWEMPRAVAKPFCAIR
jgi:hypothetical protein